MMEANFCTAMVRRRAFCDDIGPADEHIPGGYAEDYEWVLRAARRRPLAVVPEPMVIGSSGTRSRSSPRAGR